MRSRLTAAEKRNVWVFAYVDDLTIQVDPIKAARVLAILEAEATKYSLCLVRSKCCMLVPEWTQNKTPDNEERARAIQSETSV